MNSNKLLQMADYKVMQSYMPHNLVKRIETQPEKKEHNLSDSKIILILVKEALDAREAKKDKYSKKHS